MPTHDESRERPTTGEPNDSEAMVAEQFMDDLNNQLQKAEESCRELAEMKRITPELLQKRFTYKIV